MYTLSRLHKTHGELHVETLARLSDEDHKLLFKDEGILLNFLVIKNHFDITRLNIEDFKTNIKTHLEFLVNEKVLIHKEADAAKLNINRHFLNFIFSFRTYIDHLETFLKREFGNKSTEVSEFKALTGSLFDNRFEYRFFYKLRNYAQHCGIPIDIFEISTSIVNDFYTVKMAIQFDTQNLLAKFDDGWGAKLKKELHDLGKNLDAIDLTDKFFQATEEIQKWFYKIIESKIDPVKRKISQLTNNITTDTESICITFSTKAGQMNVLDSVFRYITQLEK